MISKFSFLFFILLLFIPFSVIRAASPLDLVINEIAWMGTDISANDEWIELYNNTNNGINLDDWVLKSEDGTPEIKLTGVIPANGFFLLERTDDNTVPGITADLIYKGALGNNGEKLKFYDNLGNLIDGVDCGSGWFAGDNKTKQTMERKNSKTTGSDSTNWQLSQNLAGTPKAKNSIGAETISTLPSKEKEETENSKVAEPISKSSPEIGQVVYPSGIIINEILPSPTGPDDKEEWIEIFNQNSFEVDLSGWKIEDTAGKTTTYIFPQGTKISPHGFLVFPRPETKMTLNNDGDGLILTSPDGNVVDKVNYEKASQGESYNRVNSDWVWSATLTPGATNIVEKTEARSPEDKSTAETAEKRELAAIGEQTPKSSKFLFALLIAFGLAIFSGTIILILKKKIKAEHTL